MVDIVDIVVADFETVEIALVVMVVGMVDSGSKDEIVDYVVAVVFGCTDVVDDKRYLDSVAVALVADAACSLLHSVPW